VKTRHVAGPDDRVAVLDAPVVPTGGADQATKPEEKESIDDLYRRARKPPAEGPCKGCGQDRPLNRLMLCFRCWVLKNLSDWAKLEGNSWSVGQPHPSWCHCGLPEHAGQGGGN